MKTQEIVSKLWNLASVLRNDGVTYQDYVTELTYLLFLKMMDELDRDDKLKKSENSWQDLLKERGTQRQAKYQQMLINLGNPKLVNDRTVNQIYAGASTRITEPASLDSIVTYINELDWYSAKVEGLGDLYEGLLERNARETKSGAGQYFTPRPLIDSIVRMVDPKVGEKLVDPAAGTFGFMIAAHHYLSEQTDDYFEISSEKADFQRKEAFSGMELVPGTHRLALMNAMMHDIDVAAKDTLRLGDSLSQRGEWMRGQFDVILTNPPFGRKSEGGAYLSDKITFPSGNKELNFMQVIYNAVKPGGRGAVVIPDGVLFTEGVGTDVREDFLNKCNVHTMLRLPRGIFQAGVATNVFFFERGLSDKGNTQGMWIYDLRSKMRSFGKTSPLLPEDFVEFEKLFMRDDRGARVQTWDAHKNPEGRWRYFTMEQMEERPGLNLDITWIQDESSAGEDMTLADMMTEATFKSNEIADALAELYQILGDTLAHELMEEN